MSVIRASIGSQAAHRLEGTLTRARVRAAVFALVCAILILSATGAHADGRTEINQAAALAGSVTPSDLPGFPVTLDAAGSYVLTGNLVVDDANTSAIVVGAARTSLDLAGFSVSGPISCSGAGAGLSCGAGTGVGIDANGIDGVSIRSGSVRGFGSWAIRTGSFARLSDLGLKANGGGGLSGGDSCLVSAVRADGNEGSGVDLGANSAVFDSSAQENADTGLEGNLASVFVGNVTVGNGGDGIAGLFGGNSIHSNTANANGDNGIRASDGAVVSRNSLQGNLTRNLFLNSSAGYGRNVVRSTVANPTTVVGGVNMGGNLCDNGACP